MQVFLLGKFEHAALGEQVHTALADYLFLTGILAEEKIENDADYRHETEHKNPCHGFLRLLVVHENSHDSTYCYRQIYYQQKPMDIQHILTSLYYILVEDIIRL